MGGGALMRVTELLLRLVIAGLFLYAGAIKIPEAPEFARAILNYRLLGPDLAVALAIYLPWLEITAGAGLLIRRVYAGSLALLTVLMMIFMGAVATAMLRGLDVSCGCFGSSVAAESGWQILTRDFLILCGLGFLLWRLGRGGTYATPGIGIEKRVRSG